jgi:hypothetical protein
VESEEPLSPLEKVLIGQPLSEQFLDEEKSLNEDPKKINFNRLSSFEVFNEKKTMVKNYTAHQELRKQSLETQRKEAKAFLHARRTMARKQKQED